MAPRSRNTPPHQPNQIPFTPCGCLWSWILLLNIFCICIPHDLSLSFLFSRENNPWRGWVREVQLSGVQAERKRAKNTEHSAFACSSFPQSLSKWLFQDFPRANSSIGQVRPHNRETLFSALNTGWEGRKSNSKREFGET